MIPKTGLYLLINGLPFIESRGAIPVGIALGYNPILVFISSVIINCLLFFPIYFGLKILYERFFSEIMIVKKIVNRVRRKGEPYIEKYGFIGLILFVGVPLPMTGVYSGTLLAWLAGIQWRKAFPAIVAGVLISATIITLASLGMIKFINFF